MRSQTPVNTTTLYSSEISHEEERIPIQTMTARLIEHHSTFDADPQSAQFKFDGSAFRKIINLVGAGFGILEVVDSFIPAPVSNSLEPEMDRLSFPLLLLNISPIG